MIISEVPRRKTLEWCIDNEFELVELNPIQDDSDDEDGMCDFAILLSLVNCRLTLLAVCKISFYGNEFQISISISDFQETTGVKRIVQALHAHTWPNLEMKGMSMCAAPFFIFETLCIFINI